MPRRADPGDPREADPRPPLGHGGDDAGGTGLRHGRSESFNGLHCIEFLLHLLRVAGDRLLVIWDGSPIHRRAEVKEFVARTRGRVRLEALPGYAPDLNPWDEGGWNHLKHVELRNVVCRDLEELHQELTLAVGRLRQKPHPALVPPNGQTHLPGPPGCPPVRSFFGTSSPRGGGSTPPG